MKHLTIGAFHDDTIGHDLGKKGTESDILMFNRKMEDHIFTIMSPRDDKLTPKSQIISSIDVAILSFASMTREVGETVIMLDSLGISNGIAISTPYATPEQITAITKDTTLKSFVIEKRDTIGINEILKKFDPARDISSSTLVEVDHSFSVKGVGEVILGFVKKGVVRKYQKLTLLPANKEVVVRSIQMQDEDYEEAEAGSRVGLAIKDATVEEMRRGAILCAPDAARIATEVQLSFKKNPFYAEDVREGAFHATVGMQTIPITITEHTEGSVLIESEKPFVYTSQNVFLLLDLNAKKTRIMGKALPRE